MVDETMLSFFQPAAEKVMSSADPTKAMAAALAALSGIKEIPKPRSLLAQVCGRIKMLTPQYCPLSQARRCESLSCMRRLALLAVGRST